MNNFEWIEGYGEEEINKYIELEKMIEMNRRREFKKEVEENEVVKR